VRGEATAGDWRESQGGAALRAVARPFFQRHADDDPAQAAPGREFLERCPVAARMAAVLKAVAEAPPNAFAGGGYWTFTERDYARVRQLGDEYRSRVPRSVLR
jgi:hypothetical protein